jgi:transaldolase
MISRIRQLTALGQGVWLDYIGRELISSGQLERLVEQGISGLTSNPTIFHKAIAGSPDYDDDIRRLAHAGQSTPDIYESLILAEIRAAADILRPVYNETHGRDGFVSIEVSPRLAHDTPGTIAEARRLFQTIGRPNVMIKVPATPAGIPAAAALIGEGINVNVTLIFAIQVYEQVMQAYLDGLRAYEQTGRPLGLVSSVASFFVSRVDTLVDKILHHRMQNHEEHLQPLLGLAAVANAKLAYMRFKAAFQAQPFHELRARGARPQRPLWASTGTKNPEYSDTKYIDPLIGMYTVTTVPPQTLAALDDHAVAAQTIERDVGHAQAIMDELAGLKVDMDWVTAALLDEGVRLFAESFEALLVDIDKKRTALRQSA